MRCCVARRTARRPPAKRAAAAPKTGSVPSRQRRQARRAAECRLTAARADDRCSRGHRGAVRLGRMVITALGHHADSRLGLVLLPARRARRSDRARHRLDALRVGGRRACRSACWWPAPFRRGSGGRSDSAWRAAGAGGGARCCSRRASLLLGAGAQPCPSTCRRGLLIGPAWAPASTTPPSRTLGTHLRRRARAARSPTVTLFGGFASTVCWPLSAFLVESSAGAAPASPMRRSSSSSRCRPISSCCHCRTRRRSRRGEDEWRKAASDRV